MQHELLPWERPPLESAVGYLAERFAGEGQLDLSGVVAVLPSSRAGRRLLELLVELSEREALPLAPPEITTVGRLPELLYRPQRPFADERVQQLAWVAALREGQAGAIGAVFPTLPSKDDTARWLELADLLLRQHVELAAEGIDFAAVARQADALGEADEAARWRILSDIQQAYLDRLDRLQLWDVQTARLVAIERKECTTDRHLVLIAAVDMNRATRQMIDQVADRVAILSHAPPEWRDRLDSHGCLVPSAWREAEIPVAEDQILRAEDAAAQAALVEQQLARYGGRYRADDIIIALPDERLAPWINRRLAPHDLVARWGPGRPLSESGPHKLLATAADFLEGRRFRDFAALVRHADLYARLTREKKTNRAETPPTAKPTVLDEETSETDSSGPPDLLTALDTYYNDFLPAQIDTQRIADYAESTNRPGAWVLLRAARQVERIFKPLRGAARPAGKWADPLVGVLTQIYGDREFDREDPADRFALDACDKIIAAAAAWRDETPPELEPTMSATGWLRQLLDEVAGQNSPAPPEADAIEMVGWLEMGLDDAPAAIVTSFGEGFVPSAVNSDLFLPNELRQRLGLIDNARRYARDAYVLSSLLAWRDEVALIAPDRDADNNPLPPSRLLLATQPAALAERAARLFTPAEETPASPADDQPGGRFGFRPPDPTPPTEPKTEFRVTEFRDYLACPYRYYLRHIRGLRAVDDQAEELDGGAFGSLLHEVLGRFGRDESIRGSTRPEEIFEHLSRQLEAEIEARYTTGLLAAVELQLAHLRGRLQRFAEVQAAWAAQGWEIIYAEDAEDSQARRKAELKLSQDAVTLTGRIDRIDRNRNTGQVAVLDYKSGDSGQPPEKTHRKSKEWVDLQLPLYRLLAREEIAGADVVLGYILLPKNPAQAAVSLAEWTDEELREADELARTVAEGVLAGDFEMADTPPPFSEEFAAICLDDVPAWRTPR